MGFRDLTEQIRDANNIQELLEERGIEVQRRGRSFVCLCPLPNHVETRPSFSISADGELWFCFGCRQGGDVFKLVELLDGCDFPTARSKLARRAGIELIGSRAETIRREDRAMNTTRRAFILGLVAKYYHRSMPAEVRKYLIRDRGLTEETIEQFCVGFAPPRKGLLRYLRKHGVKSREAEQLGLFYRRAGSLQPAFRDRVIFPLTRAWKVVDLIGRISPQKEEEDGERKYLKLRKAADDTSPAVFFGEDFTKSKQPLIITEGPFDAILASQLGLGAVATVGVHVSRGALPRLANLCQKASAATLVFDADPNKAGELGAIALGEKLWKLGARVSVARLPRPKEGEKVDLADFIRANGRRAKADLTALLANAPTWLAWRIEAIPRSSRGADLSQVLRSLLAHVAKLEGIEREHYRKMINKRFDLTLGVVDEEMRLAAGAEEAIAARESRRRMTKEQKDAAMQVLKRPSLLFNMGQMADRLGVVGERKNRALLYIGLTSRLLADPVSVMVKGQSSSGKSFLAANIYKLFPPEEVLEWSGMSSKALIYTAREYRHKGLIFLERKGAESAQESIRYLQSEKKLIYEVTVKNPVTGDYETQEHRHDGPVACVTTTTEASVEVDDENRCFSISPDESPEQTRRILKVAAESRQSSPKRVLPSEEELARWHDAQRILAEQPARVVFPSWFTEIAKALPITDVRIRRDWPRVLAVCEAVTLLHQYQREQRSARDGAPTVSVTLADYAMARIVVEEALRRTLFRLPPNTQRIVEAVARLYEEKRKRNEGVTYADIVRATGMSYGVVYKWAQPAREKGYITYEEVSLKGNVKQLVPGSTVAGKETLLPLAKDILMQHPELGPCEFVHPITGRTIRLKTTGLGREKQRKQNSHLSG